MRVQRQRNHYRIQLDRIEWKQCTQKAQTTQREKKINLFTFEVPWSFVQPNSIVLIYVDIFFLPFHSLSFALSLLIQPIAVTSGSFIGSHSRTYISAMHSECEWRISGLNEFHSLS